MDFIILEFIIKPTCVMEFRWLIHWLVGPFSALTELSEIIWEILTPGHQGISIFST